MIVSILSKATLLKDSDNYVSYRLPIQQRSLFSVLFEKLETQKVGLDISNIEIEYATMEQLFLKQVSLYASSLRIQIE